VRLTNDDKKFFAPNPNLVDPLTERLKGKRVLEIGPGFRPFPGATDFVDYDANNLRKDLEGKVTSVDLTRDKLPYADKEFDFIYCRHVVEDMHHPFLLLEEMSRVGKAGYIETPSAVAEMCRGIDPTSPPYRGYHHHFYIVWKQGNELRFINKYPIVEYLDLDDQWIADQLRSGSPFWNMSYLWKDEIRFKYLRSPIDYFMQNEYFKMITQAMESV
jgi:ubiquinone/menaquinone biosynthesis C-methylase UbiE